MCRIHGSFNVSVSPQVLRTAGALLRHGGPDAQTFATGKGWSLGANRLAIMDPHGGAQPYTHDGITVVFNGEIYNHDELRARLQRRGYRFADRCDGSILPALYAEYGTAFTDHLDGMYAVAVVDLRTEPMLVLAVDDAGMKPLYYRWDAQQGQIYFASELPALLALCGTTPSEWHPGLDAYLASKTPFGQQTMFEGISVLPPGSTALVDRRNGLCTVVRREASAPAYETFDEAVDEVGVILRREVRRLLIADAPLCAITSGGLDSSLVTVLAAEHVSELHTFNIAYTGSWPFDEKHYAAEVAQLAGSTHHQVELDPATFPDLLADVVWHLGQPNADPITISTFALFRAVRDAGFRVALTGDAADEMFGGYDRMRAAVTGGADWFTRYLDSLAVAPASVRRKLYTPDYLHSLPDGPTDIPEESLDELEHGVGSRLQRVCEFERLHRLPAYHLRRVDHLSMASSVEVRLPFCQPGLVAAARRLRDHHRILDGEVKRTLYRTASGLLPAAILHRPKQPFTLPVAHMLVPGTPLWDMCRSLLSRDRLAAAGQIRPEVVSDLFLHQASTNDPASALLLWSLAIYELWRDEFAAKAPARELLEVAS